MDIEDEDINVESLDDETQTSTRAKRKRDNQTQKRINTAFIKTTIREGGTLSPLPAHLMLSPLFNLLKDKTDQPVVWTCIRCKNLIGYAIGNTKSALNRVATLHQESAHLVEHSAMSVKSNLASLFAALSISTGIPFVFFEHPAFVRAFDQISTLATSLTKKNQVFKLSDALPDAFRCMPINFLQRPRRS